MKLIIDIKDDKVPFFLEMLGNFKFVTKAEQISPYKADVCSSLRQAVNEMNALTSDKPKAPAPSQSPK